MNISDANLGRVVKVKNLLRHGEKIDTIGHILGLAFTMPDENSKSFVAAVRIVGHRVDWEVSPSQYSIVFVSLDQLEVL